MGIRIVGTGLAAPVEVQTAEQLAPELNRSAAWIGKKAGVPRRHVASPDLDVTDLAVSAARQALSTGASPDLIINASTSARQLIPDSAVFLQRALGYAGIACFSVHATCLSFLVALQISNGLLATGAYQRVLLCSAEIATRGRNFSEPESAALLGDGAAAAVIEWTQTGCGLLHFAMETHPAGAALAEVRGGGLYQHPGDPETTPEDYLFSMDGPALYRTTLPAFQSFLQRFLREATISIADLRWVIPHQASGPALKALQRLGFRREQVVDIIAEYGNCVAAAMPMALATAVAHGQIERGDLVLLLGTGAGVSFGAALRQW